MSPTPAPFNIRRAGPEDRALINRFLNSPCYTHRHLDWRDPLDWLGKQPYWLLEKNGVIEGVLACLPDPQEVAWVRLFAVQDRLSPAWVWKMLFERIYFDLTSGEERPQIASLGLQDWVTDLLSANGFEHFQDIIVLSFDADPPPPLPADPALHLREMEKTDISAVTSVDNLAFEPIWRLSENDMLRAFERSTYKTVLELDGSIAGYQMSGHNGFTAHLSRLAVDPQVQRRQIGTRLVHSVLQHFIQGQGAWGVTLNTQNNNHASLALYQKIGFRLTGERFPVYVYPYRS